MESKFTVKEIANLPDEELYLLAERVKAIIDIREATKNLHEDASIFEEKCLSAEEQDRLPRNYSVGEGRKWGPILYWGIEVNSIVESFYLTHHAVSDNLNFTVGIHYQNDESTRYSVMYMNDRTKLGFGKTPEEAKENLDLTK